MAPFEYRGIVNTAGLATLAACRVECRIVRGRASSICAERNSGPFSEQHPLALHVHVQATRQLKPLMIASTMRAAPSTMSSRGRLACRIVPKVLLRFAER